MLLNAAESIEAAPVEHGRYRRRRLLRRMVLGFGLALLLVASVLAALAWQASRSTLSLDILRGRMEAAAKARLPADAEVSVGSAALSYRGGTGITLRARNVRVALPGQATILAAEISTVTTPAAVLGRRVELSAINVSGVSIGVAVPAGMRHDGSTADLVREAVEAFIAQVFGADELMRVAGLSKVLIRDASLYLLEPDGGAGPALQLREAEWMPLGAARSKSWIQMVEADGAGWDVTLQRQRGRLGNASVALEIEELPVSALFPELADTDDGPYYRSKLTLQARMVADREGRFSSLRGTLSTGRGELSFTGNDRIEIVATALRFALGAEQDRLSIPGGELRTRTGSAQFEGVADLSEAGKVTLVARLRGGALPTGRSDQPTVPLSGGGVLARADLANRTLDVELLHLVTPEGSLSAIGQASLGGSAPGLSFALSLSEMPAKLVRALWPPFVAAKTRRWFDENVVSGTLGPATLQVSLPPDFIGPQARDRILPSYALIGSLPFRDAEFSPLSTFPTIRQGAGRIDFANATATIRAESGVIAVPGKGEMQADGTTLTIPELGGPQPWGDLHLQLSGPAAALATLADTPPLSIASQRGVVADGISGEADLSLDAMIPLFDDAADQIHPTFRLALQDFSSLSPIEGRLISDADLLLEGGAESYTVKGTGTLDGIEASVDLIAGSAADGQTEVTLTLDDAARERLGLDFGGLIAGPVQASIEQPEPGVQMVALDLKDARIGVPSLGWEKGPGVPATAHFTMTKTEDGTVLSDLLVSGKGFGAKGQLMIGAEGRLTELTLTELSLRPGDRLSLSATANETGYDIKVEGSALDARGIIRGATSGLGGGSGLAGAPIRVSLDVESVTGQNDVTLSGLAGSLVLREGGLRSASLRGSANAQPFELELGREGDARILRVFADNGGALIRFLGIYSRVAGGNLILDYSGTADGPGTGVLMLRDFRVLGEAALAQAVGSSGQRRNSAFARAEGSSNDDINFSQLRVAFQQQDGVIAIEDAALRGPMLGATGSGTINLPGNAMAISGTFIPAFGINNIAGSIPLIGGILGGGKDEGLLGITYKLFGPLDGPQLTMNPISAIAPGIFRKLFEYQ